MIAPAPVHCFSINFCLFCAYTRPRYQVSVYMTIDPLFFFLDFHFFNLSSITTNSKSKKTVNMFVTQNHFGKSCTVINGRNKFVHF